MDFVEILEHHLLNRRIDHLFTVRGLSVDLTLHGLMMWIAGALLIILGLAARRQIKDGVDTKLANFLEVFIVYIRDEIVRPNLGPAGDRYLSYFLTLFFFILTCNLLGLVPWGATATGNISVTGAMALTSFVMINVSGIREHGLGHYLQSIVPHGLPFWLVPFIFVIEIMGLITKSFALCVRLFANMIAGHIVMLAFLSLIFIFRNILIAPVSVLAAVGIGLLEIFVAFLQAYIFVLLTAVFVGGAVNPQH
jgi:F-type H+-transporting ATPase subunit a